MKASAPVRERQERREEAGGGGGRGSEAGEPVTSVAAHLAADQRAKRADALSSAPRPRVPRADFQEFLFELQRGVPGAVPERPVVSRQLKPHELRR